MNRDPAPAELQVAEMRGRDEALLRAILDASMDGVITLGADGAILEFNAAAERMFGWTRDEAVGRDLGELIVPPELREAYRRGLEGAAATGESRLAGRGIEMPALRRDGRRLDVELTVVRIAGVEPAAFAATLRDVTQAREARERERREARRLEKLVELLPVGVWLADEQGRIILGNQAGQRIWAGSRYVGIEQYGEYKGWWPDGRRIAPAEWPLARAITHGETRIGDEIRIECFDGTRKLIRNSAAPVRDEEGRLLGALVVNEDITGLKDAERALREIVERFEAVARATSDAVWDWDLHTNALWWSPQFYALFGYRPGETKPGIESWYDHIHPEDKERVVSSIHAVIDGGDAAWSADYRYRRADGSYADIYDRGYVLRDAAGRALRMVGGMLDVTARKAAERALRESEDRFRSLLALSSDWFWETDAEHRFLHTPARATELTGLRAPHYVGKPRWEVHGLSPVQGDWGPHREVLARRESFRDFELVQERDDGGRVYLQVSGEPVFDAQGAFRGYRGVARDITAARRAEEELRRFRLAMDHGTDLIALADLDTLRYVDVNEAALRALGRTRDEFVGRTVEEVHGVSPGVLREQLRGLVARGKVETVRALYRRKDGSSFPVELTRHAVRADGRWLVASIARDVTEREAAEDALRRRDAFFRSLIENATDAISACDLDWRFVYVSPALCRHVGVAAEDMLGRRFGDTTVVGAPALRERLGRALAKDGDRTETQFHSRRADGTLRVHEAVVSRTTGPAGEPIYVTVSRDITDRIAAQEKLATRERELRTLVHNSPDIISRWSPDLRCLFANEAVRRATGKDPAALVGVHLDEMDESPQFKRMVRESCAEVVATGAGRTLEFSYETPEGLRHYEMRMIPEHGPDGAIASVMMVNRDMTERVQAQEEVRRKDAYFRAIIEHSGDAIAVYGRDMRLRYRSPSAARLSGFSDAERLGGSMEDVIPAEDMPAVRKVFDEVLAAPGRAAQYRCRIKQKGGSLRHVEGTATNMFHDPAVDGLVLNYRDVTDRVLAEEEVRRKDAYFRAIIEHSGDMIAVYDRALRLKYRSPSAARASGYEDAERLGGPLEQVVHPDDRPAVQRIYAEVMKAPGQALSFRARVLPKAGELRHVEGTVTNLIDDAAVEGLVINYRDVTDRVRAEDALRRFRLALDRSGELIALVDLETMQYVDVNEALCAALGYSREELLGMHPDELIPFSRDELRETYRRLTQGEEPPAIRSYYRCKDGSRFPYESRRHAVFSDGRWLIVSIARDIRRELAAEEALRKREEEFRAVAENAPDGIMRFDAGLRCLYANSAVAKTSGWPREALIGRSLAELPLSDETRRAMTQGVQRALATGETQALDFTHQGPRGLRWYHARFAPERDENGRPATVLGISSDVTDRRLAEHAMAESEARLRSIVYASAEPLLLLDGEGRTVFANPAAGALFGRSAADLEGTRLGLPIAAGRPAEVDIVQPDGGTRPAEMQFAATELDGRGVTVVSLHDLSERKRFEEHIRHLATHDGLTGLPNRAVLGDRVEQAIAAARRGGTSLALLFVDLDQFKLVNDSFGHAAGDALLNEVALRLRATVREGDTVARLGGDEFVILLTGLARAGDSALVARKIAEALDRPVLLEAGELRVTASIGISLFPDDGQDLESLLQSADAAMYRAKDLGRNAFHYYSAEMGEQARVRVETEAGLRRALEREEFRLHFQPQVDLATGAVVAVEALLRWQHPERGMISPASFIPVAEESGLIVPIGQWALRSACREAAAWNAAGVGPIKVSVNLSPRQFWRGSVTEAVRAALAESGLPASQLELEITESVVARDLQQVMLTLEQLRRMGVSIAIDDFGTGYSSLAYLRSLPIHKLKIDKSFIQNIPGDPEATALVGEIVRLAHILSLRVVAEGVETQAQAGFLREAGCEGMQGFLFSRPLPPNEFAALLRSGRRFAFEASGG